MSPSEESFQSTRPARGATRMARVVVGGRYVSIHAPRAGRDESVWEAREQLEVSIHAPRAGRDAEPLVQVTH